MKNRVEVYLGNPIAFNNGDLIMVNATHMAKPFGKKVHDFLRLDATAAFRGALERSGKSLNVGSQVVTRKGGLHPSEAGTWMCEDVAMEFARWLSPEFAIWCNDRIKELMKVGMTALPETIEAMLANPDLVIGLATQLKESRQKVAELQPKADFAVKVFEARDVFSVGTAAKMLGTGQNKLFALLREKRILKYNNEPYQTFIERGYFKTKGTLVGSDRFPKAVPQTMVTTRGLAWIRINII